MKTTIISQRNFDQTIQTTIDSQYVDEYEATFYLDFHKCNDNEYFTVSKDENLMYCWDNESEAKDYFYKIIGHWDAVDQMNFELDNLPVKGIDY